MAPSRNNCGNPFGTNTVGRSIPLQNEHRIPRGARHATTHSTSPAASLLLCFGKDTPGQGKQRADPCVGENAVVTGHKQVFHNRLQNKCQGIAIPPSI